MAPKNQKKPTQAELIQTILAQVAELRGRIERVESRAPQIVTVYQEPDLPPAKNWWSWIIGG